MEDVTSRLPPVGSAPDFTTSLALQALTGTDLATLFRTAARGLATLANGDVHIVERDPSGVLITRVSTLEPAPDPDELMRSIDALVLPIADGGQTRRLIVHPAPSTPRMVDVARQITEVLEAASKRTRRESTLVASEERLKMAQTLAGLGSYDWEIATDTNRWSDELYRIYGSEPGSFNASYEKFLSFIHPEDRDKVQTIHRRAFETMAPFEMEERIVRPDGEMRILKSNGVVIPDEHGNPARMAGICYDITEIRASEAQRRQLHDAAVAREQALAINDSIVQGLAAALGHLRLGDTAESELFLVETLAASRSMMDDLLSQTKGLEIGSGDLVRETPANVRGFVSDGEPGAAADEATPAANEDAVRVLIADDTAEMRTLTRHILNVDPNVEIVGEASTGEEAIQLSGTLLPDVLILDLAMPVMDGLTAIPNVKESSPDTVILVMTGYGPELGEKAIAAGADAYIEKGAPMEDFRAVVKRLSGRTIV